MTRPKISVPLDAAEKKRLRRLAKRCDMTLAAYVRWVLRNHMQRKQEVEG